MLCPGFYCYQQGCFEISCSCLWVYTQGGTLAHATQYTHESVNEVQAGISVWVPWQGPGFLPKGPQRSGQVVG